ncbi:TonB-dependent siderophore receptor [Porticoccaceae bacterium]|nr:TonB-dependent siderophore receptor [Porticoccaceae bacterium]
MKKVRLLNVAALCAFFVVGPVLAETSDFEEILVKGRVLQSDQMNALKTPTLIINVPQSLSIVTDEDVRKKGFKEIGDIVRYTPGINTSLGEGHRDAVVFRGVRSTADFYQDGVRDDVQYYRPLYNVEQVEVLRGPNALLFGRGGTGGIINRVSKKAVNGQDFKTVDIGVDSFGATDLAADVNTNLSDSVAFRLNVHSDSLENHRDFYNGDRFGINPTVNIALDADTDLDLSYEYIDHERFIDRGIPTANGEPVKALSGIVFGDKDGNLNTVEASVLRAALSHRFSDSTKGSLSLTSSSFEKMYQNTYANSYDLDTNVVEMDGYHDPTERDNLILSASLVNELNFANMTHTILTGFESVKTDNTNKRFNTYWTTNDCDVSNYDRESFAVADPIDFSVNTSGTATAVEYTNSCALKSSTETDITVSSFYIQDQIEVTDNLIVLLGGRYDKFDIKVNDIKKDSSAARVDTEFSPRFGLIYKPQNNVSLYYSYSESFAPRSGEQYKKLTGGTAGSGETLKPDYFESSEIGLKLDLNKYLSLTSAYFESESEIADYDGTSSDYITERGLSVDGFELELKGQVNENLNVAFSYSNVDGETAKGGLPREIPESTYSIWTTYDINPNFGWALGVMHQGESAVKDDNPNLLLPAYTRVDAAVYYSIADDLKLQLNIENLSDEVYFPHSHSTHQVAVGEARSTRLSLSKTF